MDKRIKSMLIIFSLRERGSMLRVVLWGKKKPPLFLERWHFSFCSPPSFLEK
jgi:hypothetical protein